MHNQTIWVGFCFFSVFPLCIAMILMISPMNLSILDFTLWKSLEGKMVLKKILQQICLLGFCFSCLVLVGRDRKEENESALLQV